MFNSKLIFIQYVIFLILKFKLYIRVIYNKMKSNLKKKYLFKLGVHKKYSDHYYYELKYQSLHLQIFAF
jgi:hypothetical protein